MPNLSHLQAPPMLRGDADNKLQQMWTWSYQIIEQLNLLINAEEASKTVPVEADTGAVDALRVRTDKSITGLSEELTTAIKRVTDDVGSTAAAIDGRITDIEMYADQLSQSLEEHRHDDIYSQLDHVHDLSDMTNVRCGKSNSVTARHESNTNLDVVFDTPFDEGVVPYVIATLQSGSNNNDVYKIQYSVIPSYVTNTGFRIRIFNGDTSDDFSFAFTYIAIANNADGSDIVGFDLSGEEP